MASGYPYGYGGYCPPPAPYCPPAPCPPQPCPPRDKCQCRLVAGAGIGVSKCRECTYVIVNEGLLDINVGPGLSLSGDPQMPLLSNTGIIGIVEGPGIDVSVSPAGIATITNTGGGGGGVDLVQGGFGVVVSGAINTPIVSIDTSEVITDVAGGVGINAVVSPGGTTTVSNTGVLSVTAGVGGIYLTGTAQNVVVNTTAGGGGVNSVQQGQGVLITGPSSDPIISIDPSQVTTGVSAGVGIGVATSVSGVATVSNLGLLGISAGTPNVSITAGQFPIVSVTSGGQVDQILPGPGISIDDTLPSTPVISNTGVLSVGVGSGLSLGGTSQNPVLSSTSTGVVTTILEGPGIDIDNTNVAFPIVSNTGVLSVSAGSNITVTGTVSNPVINASSSSTPAIGCHIAPVSGSWAPGTLLAFNNLTAAQGGFNSVGWLPGATSLIVPSSGRWRFALTVASISLLSTGTSITLLRNGTAVAAIYGPLSILSASTLMLDTTLNLNAGDIIAFRLSAGLISISIIGDISGVVSSWLDIFSLPS